MQILYRWPVWLRVVSGRKPEQHTLARKLARHVTPPLALAGVRPKVPV